ncbi:PREDICTED: dual specificity protein phosphatase CDC14B-like [Nicrophorus vespilloides]|uniref:protein-tyrosine-phosphatase n=1 Tax=Nicrophorus vespilloides TaxID=110193 RepID=A0ABM1NIA2_NICVS|nr:PREDICTED: dual specificity protein phosphatase CDC14B-like [Nicrophorus vespilloides]
MINWFWDGNDWMIMEELLVSADVEHIVDLVMDKLYFAVTYSDKTELIKNTRDIFYFNVDEELIYMNYYLDFGPLNISCLYKFCMKLNSYMQCSQINKIVHYTSSDPNKRVNAAYLIGAYCIIYLNMDPRFVYRKLLDSGGSFRQFVDASQGISRYTLKLIECLNGVQKAKFFNFFDFNDFNVAEYDLYDKIQNGDFNWLLPRKFLALIGPIDKEISPNGHAPSFYIKYFLKNDVRTVVRLNNKLYDPYVFSKAGIDHYDLFFPDGTTPPKQILMRFLQIAEKTSGAIAVHCKAGLGRTGSLIGAYIIKHYHLSAKEAIAWMRICRPGSVIGQQQGWLEKIEPWLWKQGILYRLEHYGEGDKLPHHKYGIYSKMWQIERKKMILMAHKRTLMEESKNPQKNFTQYEIYRVKQREKELQNLFKKIKENEQKPPATINEACYAKKFTTRLSTEKTQGDRLNEIKMRKYFNNISHNDSNACTVSGENNNARYKANLRIQGLDEFQDEYDPSKYSRVSAKAKEKYYDID